MPHILENVDLSKHSTMRLGGQTKWLAEAASPSDVKELVAWATGKQLPFMMIGEGSNIVWRDEGYNGLVIANKIMGREVTGEDAEGVTIKVGGGEKWDEVVEWTVKNGWSGIEFLSLIPGTAGAAPVQNIGAYGSELSETFKELDAFDTRTDSLVKITNQECNFSYRNSRFKSADKGRFIILGITLALRKKNPSPPFYESLQKYFSENGITEFTPPAIRQAVQTIRLIKLPDPSTVANNGSFFTNPIIEKAKFEGLKAKYPEIKGWGTKDSKIKLSAGWLVEKAGFKDVHDEKTGMGTWPAHALVLVNEHANKTADLLDFRQRILDKVHEMFGITLEQEPELLP